MHASTERLTEGVTAVELWNGVRSSVEKFARSRMLIPDHEIEDLLQETYIRVASHWSSFRHDSSATSWACTILKRLWLNQLRDTRTRLRHYAAYFRDRPQATDDKLPEVEEVIEELRASLNPEEVPVFAAALTYFGGGQLQIAGSSRATAYRKLRKLLGRLRNRSDFDDDGFLAA
jgi:RNA polymerase sigma factor (sigma-70 family)